jgi:hypothetical protein
MGASRIATHVTLNSRGQGEAVITIETNLDDARRLARLDAARLKESLLVRELVAPPLELRELLKQQGFSNVAVEQSAKANIQTTQATAQMSDVQALLGHGGELAFSEAPGSFLDLKGSLGGALAGEKIDMTPLKDVTVTLTIQFPGIIRKADEPARISHSGESVTYAWTGDELLGKATRVEVRVVPDIEETPYFWLVLILGITGVVILGVVIVLQRGRGALSTRSGK